LRSNSLPISLIVPVFNEEKNLDEFFDSLDCLTISPAQVIFVNAGSTDRSPILLDSYKAEFSELSYAVEVIHLEAGYPGKARNFGVRFASQPMIAFLDIGVIPEPGWLYSLFMMLQKEGLDGVYGFCEFAPTGFWGTIVCAASYGVQSRKPVLPASLFSKKIFEHGHLFDENLRSGEDILWSRSVSLARFRLGESDDSVVTYRHFPDTISSALSKYFVYAKHLSRSSVNSARRDLMLTLILSLSVFSLFLPKLLIPILIGYLTVRGFFDPVRRSVKKQWYSSYGQVLVAPLLIWMLDLSAGLGAVTGNMGRYINWLSERYL
jgi:glycosyltransferase involved in cell wall biosynthesis